MSADTKRIKDSKGMTLVEMVVTFAVAAIFMAAATALVLPATKMTMRVKGMNRVHDDAAIIMETIVNELSYADGYGEGEGSPGTITLQDPYDAGGPDDGYYRQVTYSDKGGNPATIWVGTTGEDEGRLLITYPEILLRDEAAGTEEVIRPEIKWEYGKGLYQGNQIQLGFKKKAGDKNIITVRLTVTDPSSGYFYTEETDVRCMNVSAGNIGP